MNTKQLIKLNNLPPQKFDFGDFSKTHCISFTGSTIKHPHDEEKFILICDPLSENTQFIEFNKDDLAFAEELPSILTDDGENIMLNKVWIKNGALALRFEPFIVGNTLEAFDSRFKKSSRS